MEQRSKYTIRTSDRRVFRRCLRKWDWQSSLRQNLQRAGTEQNINFWFGSAIHFALEDYHGWNRFKDPRRAFHAYYNAFPDEELPNGAEFHYELGMSMLSYYLTWFERHNESPKFQTAWFYPDYSPAKPFAEGAEPAVEQRFYIPLNVWVSVDIATDEIIEVYWKQEDLPAAEGSEYSRDGHVYRVIALYYHGTIDKIMIDCYGRYWLCDYKTAKGADTNKLDTDDQVSAYLWAAQKVFPFPVYGFVYQQLTKEAVQEPKRLKDGTLSVDKRQKTTYSLLKQELIKEYGSVMDAPNKLIDFLNHLASKEEPEGDRFIRWDFVKRNEQQLRATEEHIYGELRQMLWPNLYCYPTPTRDCIWECPFRDACIALDRGDMDVVAETMAQYEKRPRNEDGNIDPWRENFKWPESDADLLPLEQILNFDPCMKIELGANADAEDTDAFTFYYEEDC